MTKIVYSDPDEGTAFSGYHSVELLENGNLVAEHHLAPETVPDISDPSELARVGKVIQNVAEKLGDDGGLLE